MTVFTSESIQTTTTERSSYFELSKGTNIAKKGGKYYHVYQCFIQNLCLGLAQVPGGGN